MDNKNSEINLNEQLKDLINKYKTVVSKQYEDVFDFECELESIYKDIKNILSDLILINPSFTLQFVKDFINNTDWNDFGKINFIDNLLEYCDNDAFGLKEIAFKKMFCNIELLRIIKNKVGYLIQDNKDIYSLDGYRDLFVYAIINGELSVTDEIEFFLGENSLENFLDRVISVYKKLHRKKQDTIFSNKSKEYFLSLVKKLKNKFYAEWLSMQFCEIEGAKYTFEEYMQALNPADIASEKSIEILSFICRQFPTNTKECVDYVLYSNQNYITDPMISKNIIQAFATCLPCDFLKKEVFFICSLLRNCDISEEKDENNNDDLVEIDAKVIRLISYYYFNLNNCEIIIDILNSCSENKYVNLFDNLFLETILASHSIPSKEMYNIYSKYLCKCSVKIKNHFFNWFCEEISYDDYIKFCKKSNSTLFHTNWSEDGGMDINNITTFFYNCSDLGTIRKALVYTIHVFEEFDEQAKYYAPLYKEDIIFEDECLIYWNEDFEIANSNARSAIEIYKYIIRKFSIASASKVILDDNLLYEYYKKHLNDDYSIWATKSTKEKCPIWSSRSCCFGINEACMQLTWNKLFFSKQNTFSILNDHDVLFMFKLLFEKNFEIEDIENLINIIKNSQTALNLVISIFCSWTSTQLSFDSIVSYIYCLGLHKIKCLNHENSRCDDNIFLIAKMINIVSKSNINLAYELISQLPPNWDADLWVLLNNINLEIAVKLVIINRKLLKASLQNKKRFFKMIYFLITKNEYSNCLSLINFLKHSENEDNVIRGLYGITLYKKKYVPLNKTQINFFANIVKTYAESSQKKKLINRYTKLLKENNNVKS